MIELENFDNLSMFVSSISILIGIFMYRNPGDYFIIISALFLGLLNGFFILNIIRALLGSFT